MDDLGADAVLCDTDFTAVALCRAFRRLGLRIAEAVSVIGWGDLQMAAMFDPPLTTVSLELPTLLRRVVARLRDEHAPGESPRIERVSIFTSASVLRRATFSMRSRRSRARCAILRRIAARSSACVHGTKDRSKVSARIASVRVRRHPRSVTFLRVCIDS